MAPREARRCLDEAKTVKEWTEACMNAKLKPNLQEERRVNRGLLLAVMQLCEGMADCSGQPQGCLDG